MLIKMTLYHYKCFIIIYLFITLCEMTSILSRVCSRQSAYCPLCFILYHDMLYVKCVFYVLYVIRPGYIRLVIFLSMRLYLYADVNRWDSYSLVV